MSANDTTTSYNSSASTASEPSAGSDMSRATIDQMLGIMDTLLSHTHVFFDDYATACDSTPTTNCASTCTRGTL